MKIIIIGAGIGGLRAAKVLADGGAEVSVFERCAREEISYDWLDDAETKVFEALSIPLPEGVFRTPQVTFGIPGSDKPVRVFVDENKLDWSLERRPLAEILVKAALDAGAKISFSTPVEGLITENGAVVGIKVGGKELRAELVIDSSGVNSPFRAALPKGSGVQASPAKHEVFRVYRAFFEPAEGVEPPKTDLKKIYLKHLGEDGISWRVIEPNGDVNVLVGRIGELSEATLNNALAALRKEEPIVGTKLKRGGCVCTIPVRYPLSKMVCEGYAAIGDAAFMTIPMIGSGIANSLRAGQILAEVLLGANNAGIDTLWAYQYRYFKTIGAGHCSVDIIKRMLLSSSGDEVRFLFESGVIGEAELQSIASGAKLKLGFKDILEKIKRGIKHLGLLVRLARAVSLGEKAELTAGEIPEKFEPSAVAVWQKKLDSLYLR